MKNKTWLLLKITLINSFKLRKRSKKSIIIFSALALYLVGTISMSLGFFLNHILETLKKVNLVNYFIPLLFSLAALFAFVFSIYSAKAGLFENKDNDLLLSLPVSKKIILLSRFLYLTLFNFIICLLFVGPGLFLYLNSVPVTLEFYISIVIMLLLLPIIPTILASLFGYLIALLVSKTNKRNIFEMAYYVLFIGLYFYMMSNANKLLVGLVNNVTLMNTILRTCFLPIFLISKGISTDNLIYTLYYILINIGILSLFITILNKNYYKLISSLNSFHTKANYQMTTLTTTSKIKALYKKELKRYFSSPIYVFNTIFGVLIILLASCASLFYDKNTILKVANIDPGISTSMLVFCLLLFSIAMTNTVCCSISIEGQNFWILKMLPLKTKDIFNAKLFINKILVIPVTLLGLVLFEISGYITIIEMSLLMIFSILFCYFISNFGLIANLLLPKFDAISDTVVVKQSASTFIGLLGPVMISLILIGILSTLNLDIIKVLYLAIIIVLILVVITRIIINSWGIKRFNQLG